MYAVNVSETNVGLLTGRYLVPISGWVKLVEGEEKLEEVVEAVRRGWIKLQASEPKLAKKFEPKIELAIPKVHGSKTIPGKETETTKKTKAAA
jgi:hypothetical protein